MVVENKMPFVQIDLLLSQYYLQALTRNLLS